MWHFDFRFTKSVFTYLFFIVFTFFFFILYTSLFFLPSYFLNASAYSPIICLKCKSFIGKMYKTTPTHLDHLRGNWVYDLDAITRYYTIIQSGYILINRMISSLLKF